MDFTIPAQVQQLRAAIRAFVDAELIPLEPAFDHDDGLALEAQLAPLREKVREMGLWAPGLPKNLGGMGLSLMELALISEEVARSPVGYYVFGMQAPDMGNAELLIMHGTEAQKQRWLKPLASGQIRSCFGMTDKGTAGSNPTLLDAPAVKDGDDYVINAHKWFTSSADGAAFCIVMAVTNPEAALHSRASMIIVPLDTPGFDFVRNIPVMGEPGGGWFSHAEIRLNNVRVPQSNRLGEEGAGFALAQQRLGPGRIHHCMRWMGICQRALELMKSRANEREIKPGEVLADTQIVKQWMAECTTEFTAARALILQTAWTIEERGFAEARDMVSMIKFHAANVTQRILDTALQLHGGLGMTDDTPIAYWWRHERAARIFDGPDEVHKLSLGKRLLRA